MNDPPPPSRHRPAHHPPIERFNDPVIVLVTVCTQDRHPVLACDTVHRLCREVWQAADYWRVGRYVLMPDHVHLFCAPGRIPMPNLRQWVEFWKSRIAVQWPVGLGGSASVRTGLGENPDATEGVPPEGRNVEGRPPCRPFRKILDGTEPVPSGTGNSNPFKLWQRDFWDTQMRSREHYDEKWSYVRMNSVRQGLAKMPDDWPFQGEVFPLAWR